MSHAAPPPALFSALHADLLQWGGVGHLKGALQREAKAQRANYVRKPTFFGLQDIQEGGISDSQQWAGPAWGGGYVRRRRTPAETLVCLGGGRSQKWSREALKARSQWSSSESQTDSSTPRCCRDSVATPDPDWRSVYGGASSRQSDTAF